MENIIKIKEAFHKLFSSKIIKIYNVANNKKRINKPKLNMITKDPSRNKSLYL